MGKMLSRCYMDYAYPYVSGKEKEIIQRSWAEFYKRRSEFQGQIFSLANTNTPCVRLAMQLATGILSVDPGLRSKLSQQGLLVCEFLNLAVVDLTLSQDRVTHACEMFSHKHICTGNISLSSCGVLMSKILAFMEANIFAGVKVPKGHKNHFCGADSSQVDEAMEIYTEVQMASAWRKFTRYSLACMSETYELQLRLSERAALESRDRHGRYRSLLLSAFRDD